MRVLLAEDDETLGSGIKAGLAQHGFQVDWVRDGVAAEREILAQMHEVIILDMGLPGMNGQQVLTELKANPAVRHIPVHIISANDPSKEAIKEGAIECLVKPIGKKDLEEALNWASA